MNLITYVAIGLLALLSTSQAASFDCKKASNTVERNICSSSELTMLDVELSKEYKKAFASASNKEDIKQAQRKWITTTRNSCVDDACIQTAYIARLKQVISLSSNQERLKQGCDTDNPQCVTEAETFLKMAALESMERLSTIYSVYEKLLTVPERGGLKEEQATWLQSNLAECNSKQEGIDRWSCFGWSRDQRSMELDHRLSVKLDNNNIKPRPEQPPLHLTKDHLGVSSATPIYYSVNVDQFDLTQDSDGNYAFSFEVVGGNGHVCSGSGKAKRDGNLFSRVADQKISDVYDASDQEAELQNRNCKLEIKIYPYHIEFEGNRECHEYFLCGARASPEGVLFR